MTRYWLVVWYCILNSFSAHADPYRFETIQLSHYAWNGQIIAYPEASEKTPITSGIIYLEKNQSLPWHTLNAPMFAYIRKGQLIMEDEFKNIHLLEEGKTFICSSNILQRSHAGSEDVEIIVFYLGYQHEAMSPREPIRSLDR